MLYQEWVVWLPTREVLNEISNKELPIKVKSPGVDSKAKYGL